MALSSSTALVPEKAIVPGLPVTYAGARKASAEPSSGAPVVGAMPLATIWASVFTWPGERLWKPEALFGPEKFQSSMLPPFDSMPLATALGQSATGPVKFG